MTNFTYRFTDRSPKKYRRLTPRTPRIPPKKVSPTPRKSAKEKPDPVWSVDWEDSFAKEAMMATEKCEEDLFEKEAVEAVIACEQFLLQKDDEEAVLDAVDAAKKKEEENKAAEEDATAAAAAADDAVVASVARKAIRYVRVDDFGYCRHCQLEPCIWVQNRRSMTDYDQEHVRDVGVNNFPNDGGKSRRFPLYRVMSRLCHGPVNAREPLPKCVEDGIQAMIPSQDGTYVGFRYCTK
jgi:hypothetical protein